MLYYILSGEDSFEKSIRKGITESTTYAGITALGTRSFDTESTISEASVMRHLVHFKTIGCRVVVCTFSDRNGIYAKLSSVAGSVGMLSSEYMWMHVGDTPAAALGVSRGSLAFGSHTNKTTPQYMQFAAATSTSTKAAYYDLYCWDGVFALAELVRHALSVGTR